MLLRLPVSRLSTQMTRWPRSSSASHRCDPRKPAPPVTRDVGMARSLSMLRAGPCRYRILRWLDVYGRADPETDVLAAPAVAERTVRGRRRPPARLRGQSAALSVVSAAVLLRYLGVADYGRYASVFALVLIVGGVTEAGTANVGIRELAVLARREHEGLLAELQGVRLALTLAGVLLALVFVVARGLSGGDGRGRGAGRRRAAAHRVRGDPVGAAAGRAAARPGGRARPAAPGADRRSCSSPRWRPARGWRCCSGRRSPSRS